MEIFFEAADVHPVQSSPVGYVPAASASASSIHRVHHARGRASSGLRHAGSDFNAGACSE